MPQIEVTFAIDANGILSVKAKDKTSAAKSSRSVSNSGAAFLMQKSKRCAPRRKQTLIPTSKRKN